MPFRRASRRVHRLGRGVGLLGLALLAGGAVQAQVPVEARATLPASGWEAPVVGETITVRVNVGDAAAATPVRFVGFKLTYRPEAYDVVSQAAGPLIAGVDFDDSDGETDGLRIIRRDANIYGSGRNAFSFSVALFDGKPLVSADGQAALVVVLRVKAVVARELYGLGVSEVEVRGGNGALLASPAATVRTQALGGGAGVDLPPVTFADLGGVQLDFATLDVPTTLAARRAEAAPTGTALINYVTIAPGSWTFSLAPAVPFAAEVCFPFSAVTVAVPTRSNIRIHKRADAASPWQELTPRFVPDEVNPVQLCADVTAFSEFVLTTRKVLGLPVELTSFAAAQDGSSVLLHWTTASETGNAGFGVEQQVGEAWHPLAFVPGHGTTAEAHAYTYRVAAMPPGAYRFRLRQTDLDGATRYSSVVEGVQLPDAGAYLAPPAPNPATGATTVRYVLTAPADVRLAVYDLTGRRVAVLASGPAAAGTYAARFDPSALTAGVYVLRLEAGAAVQTTRLTVLR